MMDEVDVTAERKYESKVAYVSGRMSAGGSNGKSIVNTANSVSRVEHNSISHSRQRSSHSTTMKLRKLGKKPSEEINSGINSFQQHQLA